MLHTCEKLFKYFRDHDSGSKTIGNHSVEFYNPNGDKIVSFKYFGNTILSIALLDGRSIIANDSTYLSDCG